MPMPVGLLRPTKQVERMRKDIEIELVRDRDATHRIQRLLFFA